MKIIKEIIREIINKMKFLMSNKFNIMNKQNIRNKTKFKIFQKI